MRRRASLFTHKARPSQKTMAKKTATFRATTNSVE
jgi:hypothetical protein